MYVNSWRSQVEWLPFGVKISGMTDIKFYQPKHQIRNVDYWTCPHWPWETPRLPGSPTGEHSSLGTKNYKNKPTLIQLIGLINRAKLKTRELVCVDTHRSQMPSRHSTCDELWNRWQTASSCWPCATAFRGTLSASSTAWGRTTAAGRDAPSACVSRLGPTWTRPTSAINGKKEKTKYNPMHN